MKILKLFLAFSVFLLIYSCSDSIESIDTEDKKTLNPKDHPLCPADHAHKDGEIETRQTTWDAEVPFQPCDADNLFVLVDLSDCNENTLWECAVENAIAAYDNLPNNIGIGMTMITDENQLPAGETVNITIDCNVGGLQAAGGGRAFLRGTTDGVSSIEIGTDFENNWPCAGQTPNCCQMQKIVMHELGHALGFGHTEGGGGQTWIPGTPTVAAGDPLSVFNVSATDGWCTTTCDFTAGDLTALETLYPPLISPTIVGPSSFCAGNEATFCVTGIAQGWSLNPGPGSCFEVSFPEPGNQTISVEVCLDDEPDCCVTASIEVEVRENKDGVRCYCVCEAQEQSGRKNPIELWEVEVDCCDDRPCSELIPGWWYEYLIDDKECFKKEEEIPCDPPQVSLSGTGKICIGESGTYCISGVSGPITWNISGMGSITTPGTCLTFTPNQIGDYTISTTICEDDCCVTKSRDVEVSGCEVECYCQCEDGQSGDIIELIYDCNEVGDCQDIFYEDDIYNCKQLTRIR